MNEIYLTGTVGMSFWDEECFTPSDVREMLKDRSGPLTVRINSGGGLATDGQAIYTMLRDYPDKVTVIIDGIAASAASLIAMAGDDIVMPLGAIMMIHDPASFWTPGRGTEQDHLEAAKGLGVLANAYAAIYAKRSGLTREEAREIMQAETYFDGPGAVEKGFATVADEEAEAETVAAFDYRIYAKAPSNLRAAHGGLPRRRTAQAVLAMMASASLSPKQDQAMTGKNVSRATAAQASAETENEEDDATAIEDEDLDGTGEDENLEDADGAEGDPEEVDPEEEDPAAEGDDDETQAQARATAIMQYGARRGVPVATLGRYIAANMTLAQVRALHPKKGASMTTPRRGLPRASIRRDERDTRRAAATEALHAQMTRANTVSPAARQFMEMSLAEIAASMSGQTRVSLRSPGDRLSVFMAASHATSDFPAIFQNALNKVLLDRYSEFEPTYRSIARQKNFRDMRPMPLVRAGDFPSLLPVGETGEIQWGTFGESGEEAVIAPYARGLTISRTMMINDDLGAIADMMGDVGSAIAYFEERVFYAAMLSAKLKNGTDLFHANHGNLASAGTAITKAALSAARAAMRKQKSIDGQTLNLAPSILLVGPDKETEAEAILAEITPTQADQVNPFSGKLRPVVTAEITGNAWYVFSDRAPSFVYGFLEGSEAPRIRTEEPFGTQGFAMTVEHDFGFGAADHRGAYKNPGA